MNKPTLYNEIFGWFGYERIYDMIFENLTENSVFVEIGCFFGKSTAYFGELIKLNNKKILFYGIDHFRGSDEEIHREMLKEVSLIDTYFENIIRLGLQDFVNTIPFESAEAVKYFKNNSIDAIFIDGGHTVEDVSRDIELWYPKVKNGGLIAGHDYYGSHPGVKQAVDYYFKEGLESDILTECWWITKNAQKPIQNRFV